MADRHMKDVQCVVENVDHSKLLIHCQRESIIVQPFQRSVWPFPVMLNMACHFHTYVFTWGKKNLSPQKDVHVNVPSSSVDDILHLKQPRCPSAGERIIRLFSVHTTNDLLPIKRNKLFITAWGYTCYTLGGRPFVKCLRFKIMSPFVSLKYQLTILKCCPKAQHQQ